MAQRKARREVGPYLLAQDGSPYRYGGKAYVDAVIDPFGRALCQTCVAGILPDGWTSGPALPHHPKILIDGVAQLPFVWWFTEKLADKARREFYAYLANPACSPRTHAWLEKELLQQAIKSRDAAQDSLFELRGRPKGWSISARATDTPAPMCASCSKVLPDTRHVVITNGVLPGAQLVSVCAACWGEVAPEIVALIKSRKEQAHE